LKLRASSRIPGQSKALAFLVFLSLPEKLRSAISVEYSDE